MLDHDAARPARHRGSTRCCTGRSRSTPGRKRSSILLETQFAVERATLEAHMRSDNAALAAAIAREHDDGPAVAAAVDRAHRTMGALQKATLAHVFAMRRLLHPDQTAAFDRLVVRALTPAS
ncbi:periplasmic heavy metal sensor [Sphingomonas aurantiaca]|uniref:periplasmic heavy metal sensor n=1 Tax=Sphingomonas aurantiaca TaxID=185949 RepID=UPI002FE240EC